MTGLNSHGAHDTLSFRRTKRGEILQHNNKDFSLTLEMTGLNSQDAHEIAMALMIQSNARCGIME
jgi:hypothetical protein